MRRFSSEEEELEVDTAGKADGKCRRCCGKGHSARDCPTPVGKGIEGAMAAGNGFKRGGEGQWTGSGKGIAFRKGQHYQQQGRQPHAEDVKGTGKGHQGTCYKCGNMGHKAAACPLTGFLINIVHVEPKTGLALFNFRVMGS